MIHISLSTNGAVVMRRKFVHQRDQIWYVHVPDHAHPFGVPHLALLHGPSPALSLVPFISISAVEVAGWEKDVPSTARVPCLVASRTSTPPCRPHRRCGVNLVRMDPPREGAYEVQCERRVPQTGEFPKMSPSEYDLLYPQESTRTSPSASSPVCCRARAVSVVQRAHPAGL